MGLGHGCGSPYILSKAVGAGGRFSTHGPGARLCTRRGAPTGMQRTEIVHAEQMRLLYANAPAGCVATVLNVALLALIQWPVIAPPRIVSWLTSMLVLTALRVVVVWRFRRCSPTPP